MKRVLRVTGCALGAAILSAAVMAATYTWTGLANNNNWEAGGNWTVACCPSPSYPSTTNDNANFNYHVGGWGEADLTADRTIHFLTVKTSLTISTTTNSNTSVYTLTAAKLTLDAASGDADVTATETATIVTN